MYICVTEVDALTKIPCTEAPQSTGPSMPNVKGLKLDWCDKSTWPVPLTPFGVCTRPPRYYGICDDDASTNIPGVLEVLSEAEWNKRKYEEAYARKPYPSWYWNPSDLTWNSPVPYPENEPFHKYYWDENSTSWKEHIIMQAF